LLAGDGAFPRIGPEAAQAQAVSQIGPRIDPTVSPEYAVAQPVGRLGNQGGSAVAWGANNFLVVWSEGQNQNADLFGTLVDQDGAILSSAFLISSRPDMQFAPTVAWNGTNYLVAWLDSGVIGAGDPNIYAARVSPNGNVLDPAGIPVSTAPGEQT